MSNYPRKIDRAAAERLLRGEPADPRHPDDLLAVLLATAAAPAHAGELAGEEAAVAAFRQSRAAVAGLAARPGDEVSIAAERSWRTAASVRGWTRHPMRLAIVALAATTAGGVALANGSVPWSQQPADRRPATGSTTPSELPGPGSGQRQAQGQGGAGTATPHPSPVGLCRAYQTGAGDAPGKALDNPAFTSLIKAAGGKDKVAAYCADVLAAEAKRAKKSTPSGQATTPDHPGETGQPALPTPTGKPTRRPTVLPTPTVQPPSKSIPSRTKAPQTRLLSA